MSNRTAERELGGDVDFVHVYQTQLAPVWRYVRSRIPDPHEAEDVTSEVFARAWRSWGNFDAGRGGVAPWLLRIAQRTVVDWNRRKGRAGAGEAPDLDLIETAASDPSELPETVLLAKEVLIEVNQALHGLSDRERDGIALRFGAGLKMADVGRVLGLSTAATKMMIGRSLNKLAETLAQGRGHVHEESPLALDELVDEALKRGRSVMPDPALGDLVLQLAVLHRPKVPADLPKQVQFCVDCATSTASRVRAALGKVKSDTRPNTNRFGSLGSAAFAWAPLSPICLACTIPVLIAPLVALGMSLDVAYWLHALSLFTAPLVALVIWRHFQRHGVQVAMVVGGAGAALLVAHLIGHLAVPDGIPGWSVVADRMGTALLLAGAVIDAIALNRWVLTQRQRLAAAAAEFRLAPA